MEYFLYAMAVLYFCLFLGETRDGDKVIIKVK